MKRLLGLSIALLAFAAHAENLGDFAPSTVIYDKFTTYRPSTGAAFTLAGTPAISVYKDNSTTQSTAGVTLNVDFDGVTGLNHVTIDTSADGTFYSSGSSFSVVITAGTVDSVSVVGSEVASFTLNKTAALRSTTAGRTVDVTTGGNVGIDLDNVAITNSVPTSGILASGTLNGTHSSITADLGANAPGEGELVGTTLFIPSHGFQKQITAYDTSTGVATFATTSLTLANGDQWYLFATAEGTSSGGGGGATAAEIWSYTTRQLTTVGNAAVADAVWDEDMTGHQTLGTAGQAIGDPGTDADSIWSLANTNLNATISSRASQASVDTIDDLLDTEIATITSQTTAAAFRTAIGLATANLDTQLSAIDDAVDTEIGTLTTTVNGIGTLLDGITDGSGSLLGCTFTVSATPPHLTALSCTPP